MGADAHVSTECTLWEYQHGQACPLFAAWAEVWTVVCMLADSAAASGLMYPVGLTIAFNCDHACSKVDIMLRLAGGLHGLLFPVMMAT